MAKKKKRSMIQKLPSILALVEAGKSQANIGDCRELVKKLSVIIASEPRVMMALLTNGVRVAAKQPRLARKLGLAIKRS